MKNLLLITPFFRPNVGGVETRFHELCEELRKKGHKVFVLTYQPIITKAKGKKIEKKKNLEIRRLWWPGFNNLFHKLLEHPFLEVIYLVPGLLFYSLLFMLKNNSKIDAIHAPGFNAGLVGKILKGLFGKRLVISTHAIYNFKREEIRSKVVNWILKSADKVVVLSAPSKRELEEIGISPEKIVIHITWVDQEIFRPNDRSIARKKLKLPENFTVLFVGRFLKIKGADVLLKVAKEVPKANFVFVGSGPYEKKIKKLSKNRKNVAYVGKVKNYDLPSYYNASDLFVLPSQYNEGLGRVVLEALSCGVPVICTNTGGLAEILDSNVSIVLKPTKKNIKNAISELFNNEERLNNMRSNARIFAKNNFSPDNVEDLIKAYKF